MSLLQVEPDRAEHPVDVVERLAALHQWSFDREDEDEISISVEGQVADFHVAFTWLPELEALHVGCAFDLKVPDRRRSAVQSLVSLINEQLWIGHFDLWSGENVVMFRHSLLMSGGADPDGRQCEAILKMAVAACDRYYQAFHFVLWAGKSAREALDGAMFETEGEAMNEAPPSAGFILLVGAGRMGRAMLDGWLATGIQGPSLAILEPDPTDGLEALCADRESGSIRPPTISPHPISWCWPSSRKRSIRPCQPSPRWSGRKVC